MPEQHDDRFAGGPRASAVLAVAAVAGASISTMGGLLQAETVSATDERIARVDELQFDLGVGPCWDALAQGLPILEPDLSAPTRTWPGFSEAVQAERIAALFAVPMVIGPLRIGAIDLYDMRPGPLAASDLARTVELAAVLARQLLRRAIAEGTPDGTEAVGPHSRRTVHQATGFVIAQVEVSAEDARLLIQASAYAEGRPVQEIAEQIVGRERSFSRDGVLIRDGER